MVTALPYGSWPSPLSPEQASTASPRLEGAAFVGDEVWWGESVPAEGGRTTVRRRLADGTVETVLPAPWNARSRVHEYGGGSWAVTEEGALLFVDKADQRVRMLTPGAEPRALTPEDAATSYGGLRWQHGALLAVREWQGEGAAVHRGIVRIATSGEPDVRQLVSDSDFVAQPALAPDGSRLAWVAWDHPHMPWDRTEVRVGRIDDDRVRSWSALTDGATAALQPEWRGDDEVVFVDEPTGRWNLWHRPAGPDGFAPAAELAPADADTGGPLWSLDARWYAVLDDGRLIAVRTDGADELVVLPAAGGEPRPIPLPATARLNIEAVSGSRVLVSGVAPGARGIWLVDVDAVSVEEIAGACAPLPPEWMPQTQHLVATGPHGPVHAYAHPPTHPDASGPDGALPPYVVRVHGGPTAHDGGVADERALFYTSRGIGVLDVDYGGSTGYGREYRQRLNGQWGVVDVDDVVAAASALAASGAADPARIAIRGGSAGGWTVLSALARTDAFAAGISQYGVADARALAHDTHDFESRYLDGLIGPLPDAEEVYRERSPLTHVDGFSAPVLLLQGSDDRVVPPAQSEAIRDALAQRGVPHAYRLYEGEGHGFRGSDALVDAYRSEIAFLGAVFGFDTPGIPPLALD